MIAVVENTGFKAADNTSQNTHIERFVNRLERRGQNQIADSPRKTCRTIVILGQSYANTNGKNQCQIIKDRSTGLGDKRDVQDIRSTETQQQRRCRQNRNRQHKGLANALQLGKPITHNIHSL